MRWSGRTAVVLCAAACTGPLLAAAPAVAAQSALEKPQLVGFFNALGPKDTGTPAGSLPNVATNADGVAEGDLGVQGGRGQEQQVSFLLFPAEPLLAGGTATRAVLTVPLSTQQGSMTSPSASPESIRACKVDETGFAGEDGADLAVAPARLCDEFEAVATASSDGTAYVFDITDLAKGWTEANDGLALTVTEDAAPTKVVFSPDATLLLEYEPAAEEEGGGTTTPDAPGTPELPVDSGTSGGGTGDTGGLDLGGFDSGTDTGAAAPLDGFGSGTSADPVLAAPDLPLVEAAPGEVAPELAAPQAIVPAASTLAVGEADLTPTAGFWLAAVLFGAVLALVSLVMGDSAVRTTRTRPSRLDQALSARQPAASGRRVALS